MGLPVGPRRTAPRPASPARGSGAPATTPIDAALDLVAARADRAFAVGRVAGWATDGERQEVEAEVAAAEAGVAEALARFRSLCGRPPVGPLTAQFGLSELATELVLVAAAPWLRPQLAPVFTALGGAADGAASLLLCARLLHERSSSEILAELDEEAPLVRHHLLGAPTGPAAALQVHPLLVPRLRGAAMATPGRQRVLSVPAAALALEELALPSGLADSLLSRFASGAPRWVVRGRAGSGRRSMVTALADAHGRQTGFIDARAAEIPPAEAAERLASELRDAVIRGLLPCAVGVDELPAAAQAEVAARLAAHPGPLVVIAGPTASSLPGLETVDLPPQSAAERAATVARALRAQHLPEENIESIAARVTAPPGLLWRAAEAASTREWPESHSGDLEAAFVAAHKRLRAARLTPGTGIAAPSSWRPALFDAVTEDALAELRARCARSVHGDDARAVALLVGPTGSGRRLAAEISLRSARLRPAPRRPRGAG